MVFPFRANHDVAISYRAEDISKAEALYEALASTKLRVFFDRNADSQITLWGKNVKRSLAKTYRQSSCCVLLLSDNYFQSQWTKLELRSSSNALPVVVGPLKDDHRKLHDIEWPLEGAPALVPIITDKLERIKQEQEEFKKKVLLGIGGLVTSVAATAIANKHTQDQLEESTGSIDGHWADHFNRSSWQIEQNGHQVSLRGKLPNGIDILAFGSRHGRDVTAEWSSPMGRGTIQAKISSGGKMIQGQVLGMYGHFPFHLVR